MNLPKREIIKGSSDKDIMDLLVSKANEALRTWEVQYSKFISAPLREELFAKLKLFNDIYCLSNGGYIGAERTRISFLRVSQKNHQDKQLAPIKGINIEGNFLFDRAEKLDFINALKALGAQQEDLGDLWLKKDRGAQVLCTPEASIELNGKIGSVRGVEITCESLELSQLHLPPQRLSKKIQSVEASKRIDAIASAGFGLSRAKITNQIKEGRLRLNWKTMTQSSRSVGIGDRIQLEGKGSIEVLNIELTKRERWRIELLRQ